MPNFDIVKKSDVGKSFRVEKIKADFDVNESHSQEHFKGQIDIPEKWNIGIIVGESGTGKSTIAKALFPEAYIADFAYTEKSVIDDMPSKSMDEIEKMFYAVGFGSVPSWLKPYGVLSNGEKMRVDLARALLEKDFVVFDEFTSVVDRNVAETMCIATARTVRAKDKKFIAVSCHRDILQWLEPDWVFDTNTMTTFFGRPRDRRKDSKFENAIAGSGKSFGVITI